MSVESSESSALTPSALSMDDGHFNGDDRRRLRHLPPDRARAAQRPQKPAPDLSLHNSNP